MTFTFKLARRLARFRAIAGTTAILLTLSCADDGGLGSTASDPLSPSADNSVGISSTDELTTSAAKGGNGKGRGRGRNTQSPVSVSPESVKLAAGAVQTFTATATRADGSTWQPAVKWTATGGTVDSNGQYTAGSNPGQYRVVAIASDGVSDTATANVVDDPPAVQRVVLTPATSTVASGETQQFTAVGKASDGSSVSIDPTYRATGGTITAAGLYTAGRSAGTYRVIATDSASGLADTAAVTIEVQAAVATVTINPSSASVAEGKTTQLTAVATDANGNVLSGQTFTWASSNSNVATVTSSGLVTGVNAGTASVTATVGTTQGRSTITVTAPPTVGGCSGSQRTVNVSTMAGLSSALSNAQPGDCILMAAATYTLGARLIISRSGTASSPIVIQGAGSSTILNANQQQVLLDGSYVQLRRLRVTNLPSTGLWLRGAHHSVLDSMEIDHARQELVAFKFGSHHNTISRSHLHHSGTDRGDFAEGVYVGGRDETGNEDYLATDNQILDNTFDNIWTEAIDVKAGAARTIIRGNVIDGRATQFYNYNAVSLIAMVGDDAQIRENTLIYGNPHGIVFFTGSTGSMVQGNRIQLYDLHDYSGSLGVKVSSGAGATVRCDNAVEDIPPGGSAYNVTCTR